MTKKYEAKTVKEKNVGEIKCYLVMSYRNLVKYIYHFFDFMMFVVLINIFKISCNLFSLSEHILCLLLYL